MSVSPSSPSSGASSGASSAVPERELTARALLTGALLGSVLAAGNVYTGLKSAAIDGGSITAALLSFTLFATFGRFLGGRLSAREVNVAQTTASSAAILSFVGGFMGPIPALSLLNEMPPAWILATWTLTLGLAGSLIAWGLRDQLITRENLPFPTGAATAEVVAAMVANDPSTSRRARLLLITAPLSALLTWLRDGLGRIPQSLTPPLTFHGVAAADLNVGLSLSPLMLATGVLMGFHASASFLAGGAVAWLFIGPRIAQAGIVQGNYLDIVSWTLWPAIGLLTSSTLIPLAFEAPAMVRTLRDLRGLLRAQAHDEARDEARDEAPSEDGVPSDTDRRARLARKILGPVAVLGVGLLGARAFDLAAWETALVLVLMLVFAAVCGRAAGETDVAPVGALGTLTQIFFARGPVRSIGAGSAVSGAASQVAQSLWAFKAAQRLGASPSASLHAQWVGIAVGTAVVVPVFFLLVKTHGVGSAALPAVSAQTWKATALALRSGLEGVPRGAAAAFGVGLFTGSALALVSRFRPALARVLPSPIALALGLICPFSLAAATFLGATLHALFRRFRQVSDGVAVAVASGGMVGESLAGVLLALWASLR